jgi:acyl-CoA synthetase (NDP forming)
MPVDVRDALAQARAVVEKALAAGRPALNEAEAKQVLAAYGVPVPAGGLAHSAAEAGALAASLGVPVVLKAVGALIQHKTERQLVVLGVRTPDEAAETYVALAGRAGDALEGVLVEEMVAGSRELMAGMKRDAAFGPVVAFGLGGTMTEVFRDIALAITPGAEGDVAELPDLIRGTALLGAFRGQPAVDREKLVAVIEAVARIAADHPRIAEIDVNPLLVRDGEPVAADALMILSAEAAPAVVDGGFAPDLDAVLAPRSVAIVGASGDVTRWGGSALQNILAGGFEGAVYPINPKGGEFFGLPVSASLEDVPAAPDLALLAVGARQLEPVIAECGRAGVRAAVAIAAGFSETGSTGEAAERGLAQTAAAGGVTLIGPNCMGIIANATHLHATGFISLHPRPGNLAIVSQSGNLGVQLSALADRRDLGVRCFIGVGNEAQVSAVDVLEYLADDDGTSCVLTYLEGIDDGRRLFDVARATSLEKPVVVLRGGLTDSGGRAAASHTGAMAGSAAVYEAAARQAGLVTCTSVQEALDLATALAHLPLPRGRRVAVITNGGGAGVLAADEMARQQLTLLDPPAELLEELDEILPPFWSRRNPFDMVATAGGDVGPRVVEAVTRCPDVDAVVVLSVLGVPNTGDEKRAQAATGDYDDFSPWEQRYLDGVAALMAETGKPIVNVPDLPIRRAVYTGDHRYAPVVVPTPRAAALVLQRMASYGAWRSRHMTTQSRPKDDA